MRSWYRCRDCGRSFQGGSQVAIYLLIALAVGVVVLIVGSLGFQALDATDAQAEQEANALEFSQLLERARHEDPNAQYELYRAYAREGAFANRGEAQEFLSRSAQSGHADAQYELASALREGIGVVQDYARALKWMESAAAKGNWKAHHELGLMYRDGIGTPPDPVKAYIHLNVAAARGLTDAAKLRNAVMTQLTSDQLLAAQAQARRIVEGKP